MSEFYPARGEKLLKEIRDRVTSCVQEANICGVRALLYAYSSDTTGWLPVTAGPDATLSVYLNGDNIALRDVPPLLYDFAVRRCGGKLLSVVDFLLNQLEGWKVTDLSLRYIYVEGDYASVDIVRLSDEGIPKPEADDSPYALKIVVKAGGTVWVRVPLKARFWAPVAAYFTVYNRDYEMEYRFYISLGGLYQTSKQQISPKYLKLPANTWGRYCVHWFMEAHHGCIEVDVEIYNPNTVDVTVYIGMVSACEIHEFVRGHGLLIGWESGFYIPLNNETFDWIMHLFLPNFYEAISMTFALGIESLDGTTVTGEIYIQPGNRKLADASTTSSTQIWRDVRISCYRQSHLGWSNFDLEFKVGTTGSAKITMLQVVLRGFDRETTYMKYGSWTVSAGSTIDLANYLNDDKHIVGAVLDVSAPTDGSVDILADTVEGTVTLYTVPAGTTRTVEIRGRYYNLQARNNSATSQATITGVLYISNSLLIR